MLYVRAGTPLVRLANHRFWLAVVRAAAGRGIEPRGALELASFTRYGRRETSSLARERAVWHVRRMRRATAVGT